MRWMSEYSRDSSLVWHRRVRGSWADLMYSSLECESWLIIQNASHQKVARLTAPGKTAAGASLISTCMPPCKKDSMKNRREAALQFPIAYSPAPKTPQNPFQPENPLSSRQNGLHIPRNRRPHSRRRLQQGPAWQKRPATRWYEKYVEERSSGAEGCYRGVFQALGQQGCGR